jgi:hypothetical protein
MGMAVPACAGFCGAGEAPARAATFFVVAGFGGAFGAADFLRSDSSKVFSFGTPSVCAPTGDSPDTAHASASNAIQRLCDGGARCA